jgi:hypothetical protein
MLVLTGAAPGRKAGLDAGKYRQLFVFIMYFTMPLAPVPVREKRRFKKLLPP